MIKQLFDKKGKITAQIDVIQLDSSIKKYYISSRYDVEKEANDFVLNYKCSLKKINILYGLGLGYHINSLSHILDKNQKLFVFENRKDIYEFGKLHSLYDDWKDNIILKVDEDENIIISSIKKIIDKYDENDIYFFKNNACINAIHSRYSPKLKYMMENIKIFESKNKEEINSLIDYNISENIKLNDKNASIFFNKFKNIPAFLLSSGTSLKYSMDLLKNIKNKALIMTVARNMKTLDDNNIKYDMSCTLDSKIETLKHIQNVNTEKIPLFYLSSANSKMISEYKGNRFISFNDDNKYFDSKFNIDTGGSVATLGLSLLLKFGCNPIIFAGQDFAYVDNSTHIDKNDGSIKTNFQVMSNLGEILYTTANLLSFKYWFEKTIRNNKNVNFYNLSRGAVIEGTKYTDEKKIYNILKNEYEIDYVINYVISKNICKI